MSDVAAPQTDRAASVGALLLRQAAQSPHREAFRYPAGEDWASLTWQETKDRVFELAGGLIALGVEPEQRAAIAAGTSIDWVLADLAIMCAGAATTTVYPNTKAADVGYILTDSESRVVFAEDDDQVAKVLDGEELPHLLKVITFGDSSSHESVITMDQLAELGRGWIAEHPDGIEQVIAQIGTESLATLIYTSGTTGRPKGVRLVHDSWVYEGEAVQQTGILVADDLQYLWLPLSHVFGKALLAIQLTIGFSSAVDGRIDKIVDGLGVVQPTFMAGAPRIFEKVRAKVNMQAGDGLKKKIFDWAFSVGRRTTPDRLAGRPLSGLDKLQYGIAHKLVFSKLEARMGGRIRFFVSGSAALNREVQEWFYAAGLLILEGYGLTESSAATFVNMPYKAKLGTVGPPLPGTEVKIAEDGEILVKGRGVMRGYHNLDEETADVLVDGWLHTGDIGHVDSDQYLTITDRKKDLIKTSGGKYVAPQKIEGALKAASPYLSQVIVHGDKRKYVTALVTLDEESIMQWAAENGHGDKSYVELTKLPAVKDMVNAQVEQANDTLERWETVKAYAILDADLSVDDGEVTPSMKVRRKTVAERNAETLDSLYGEE
ncbi:AMP-dependent synthetase/ligase [Propionibacteriaceae bacterium Y2011]|uniref:AMP-dependent synthetase/ligase n=1 Tax=Microlunatus sp. Y2014 TaxID=3418488 RepID=UPI003B4F0791